MSAAAKKRSEMKSRGTDKTPATPTPGVDETAEGEKPLVASAMSLVEEEDSKEIDLSDPACFNSYMIKPANVKEIWSIFKVKKAMQDFM